MNKAQIPVLLSTALRETKSNLRDFRVMVLSLFLGVFVISLIYNITDALENGLNKNGKAILGGDVLIRQIYNPITADQLNYLATYGTISQSIEMRGLVYNDANEQAGLSEIKAIDDHYPLFGKIELTNAGLVDNIHTFLKTAENGKPNIVMDEGLKNRLELNIGETVQLGSIEFTLKDTITNEPDRAGGGTFTVAPRTMLRIDALKTTKLLVPGAQTYYKYRIALSNPDQIDALESSLNDRYAEASWRFRKYTNASPRIERFLEQLSLFFTLVGLSALLIGGVGIGNATKVVIQKRVASIAVMKTLGASKSFVFYLWVAILTMTSLIGVIPAIILAQILPFIIFDTLGPLIPITAIPTISFTSIIQSVFLAFSILFLFSILTLSIAAQLKPALLLKTAITNGIEGKADKSITRVFIALLCLVISVVVLTSPRPDFTLAFTIGALATFLILRVTSWCIIKALTPLKNSKKLTLRLAVLSLVRTGNQTLTILVALGLALTLFTMIALIEDNIKNRISDDIPEDAPAFFFIDIQKSQMAEFEAMLQSFPDVADLQKVPNLRGRIKYINGENAEDALVDQSESWLLRGDRGFTYLTEQPKHSELLDGEWWSPDYDGPPIISIVEDVADAFDIGAGDEITLNVLGRDITATVANVRSVNWSTMTINFSITFAPGTLDNAPHSYLATIIAPEDQENKIMSAIAQQFPNITAIQVREALQIVTDILEQIAIAMRVIASLALVTGILVLFSSILSTFRQRRYETILMKVIGVTPKMIARATKIEFAILGLAAGTLALLIGSLGSYLVVVYIMKSDWVLSLNIALSTVSASLVITFIFSFWALSRILQAKPHQYLRNE